MPRRRRLFSMAGRLHFCLCIPAWFLWFSQQRDTVVSCSVYDPPHPELLQRILTLFLHTRLIPVLLAVLHTHKNWKHIISPLVIDILLWFPPAPDSQQANQTSLRNLLRRKECGNHGQQWRNCFARVSWLFTLLASRLKAVLGAGKVEAFYLLI